MKLAAVTRLLNEDEILEAFIRHHGQFVQAHILLDNGSSDRSLDILAALQREGFNLSVYRNASPVFAEPISNTALLGLALRQTDADWIAFLDCDEFIDDRLAPGGLANALAGVPVDIPAAQAPLLTYVAALPDPPDTMNCVERIVLRQPRPETAAKVIVRHTPDSGSLAVSAGSHFLLRNGQALAAARLEGVHLAHFPERSAYQVAVKGAIGRLKVLATGQEGATLGWSEHYNATFEALRDNPDAWLRRAETHFQRRNDDDRLVHDPMPYRGGNLRYTTTRDPVRHAVSALLHYAERLAMAHGRLMDAIPAAGQQVVAEASKFTRVL